MVNVEFLLPGVCGANTTLSLHFFLGERCCWQVVTPDCGNPNSCGLVTGTENETGFANVIGAPFFAVLLRRNVKILPLPTFTGPKLWLVGLGFRCPGTGVDTEVAVAVAVA